MDSQSQNSSSNHNKNNKNENNKSKQGQSNKNEPKLIDIVQSILSKPDINHHQLMQRIQNKTLYLRIIEKKPLYVADWDTCMQALYFNKLNYSLLNRQQKFFPNKFNIKDFHINKKLPSLDPNNKLSTQFYGNHSKPQLLFNCRDETITQQKPKFPSAYHPAYYYPQYEEFLRKKNSAQILTTVDRIQVTKWSIAIVNISESGYYAPILIIYQFKKITENSQIMNNPVQSILFSNRISTYLDSFRINDIRKLRQNDKQIIRYKERENGQLNENQEQPRFSYYMRGKGSFQQNQMTAMLISLDTRNKILKNNQTLPSYFLPLGQLSPYSLFKRPIPPKYFHLQKRGLMSFQYQKYARQQRAQQQQQESQQVGQYQFEDQIRKRIVADIQSDDLEQVQNKNKQNIMAMRNQRQQGEQSEQFEDDENENEGEDEDEDFLRKLYQKRNAESKDREI